MTEDEVRRFREALYVLQEQLLRNLLFDALKIEEEDRLNFFRVYRGALLDGVVTDWWKVFGNRSEPSHWKSLFPVEQHDAIRGEICAALADLEPTENYDEVWSSVERYRNTSAAHLDFDEATRAQKYPRLTPLRVSAEIIYRKIFERLDAEGRERGFPPPDGMTGDCRAGELEHYKKMCCSAREALKGFKNSACE